MSALAAIIRDEIAAQGPMRLDRYMELCLLHPAHGYYTQSQPFGATGDFVTAPEINQMFGELLGLWGAQVWLDAGRPTPFNLIELGPGRGTMMADMLRATRAVQGFHEAVQVALVEASPAMQTRQRATLAGYDLQHFDDLSALPKGFSLIFANEFFDALPIRQFQSLGEVWMERAVVANGDALAFGLMPIKDPPALPFAADGTIIEHSEPRHSAAAALGAHLHSQGGAALVIDYGRGDGVGDSLQAVRAHAQADPLEAAGTCDLTSHVNFDALAKAAVPATATPLLTQGEFLGRLGIVARAAQLAQSDPSGAASALERLTRADAMGEIFKVMALSGAKTNLPGWDA